ncbi:SDR family oxidoreductase [Xylophilus sp. GOD-11R]|uniref:SDR family NAD(P)-dependent oxidoreductase n=1 Tax=Xylophilus sp. GOD-11R TaxID=3089814 RepID=UPI00298C69D8|nr:SDR family oxidoreductase [Xylophilus sp. GOD-11R]WPB56069.1 SDR family oxidoreductase [Xylophilus sp. GOD-11R]
MNTKHEAVQRLAGRVCLLIGGGSSSADGGPSNGQAVALTFARQGATVVVVDLQLAAAEDTVRQIVEEGGRAVALQADAARHAQVSAVVAQTVERFGRIDILYNNVGIEVRGGVVDTSEDDWDRVHDVNLKSVFLACKEVLPHMERAGRGAIVNVSSTASLRWTTVEFISYNTSKAALNQLTRVMARTYAPKGIRCNAILPGMIDTPHIRTLFRDKSPEEFAAILAERDARCPMGRQGSCWDVANAALFLVSDEAAYVSGVLLPVDGALSV